MSNTAWMKVIDNKACVSQGSIYSDPIDLERVKQHGLKCVIESGTGDVDVTYEIIESNKAQPGLVTQQVTEGKLAWTAPVNPTILQAVTDAKADDFVPMVTRWLRIKVTGNAGNGADCYVSIKLSIYSE
jgi:hypothetical protein